MAEPASAAAPDPIPTAPNDANGSAPTERGWGKLFLALAAFILLPKIPQLSALLPVEQTMVLFVPALAACALVGWWAGGRAFLAIAWVALAVLMSVRSTVPPDPFYNLARGWSLLLAGSFGSYLSPASAVRIGLVPDVALLRIVSAGNVAGEGAKMALLSLRERAAAQALLEEVHYVELSDRADFNDRFVERLAFPD